MDEAALLLSAWWPGLASAAVLAGAILTSTHAILFLRDARASLAWVGLIWLVPLAGVLLYVASLIGSANWDPRSLRLNFEFNVECYDPRLARGAMALVEERLAAASPIDQAALHARPRALRLRDGLARLFSGFL